MIAVYPVQGWQRLPRTQNPRKAGMCAAHSLVDSFDAPRGDLKHSGQDIFASLGTPCVACVAGKMWANVANGDTPTAYTFWKSGGNHCYIAGDDGNLYYYAHLHQPPLVRPGQRVTAGQLLGYVGQSGNALHTCPHLHFQAYRFAGGRKGAVWNPYAELKRVQPAANPLYEAARYVAEHPGATAGVGAGAAVLVVALGLGAWGLARRRRRPEGVRGLGNALAGLYGGEA
jgi:murein DD-endopeptidase MepM/ murein hydrolase activator NlpD